MQRIVLEEQIMRDQAAGEVFLQFTNFAKG
jgi:hypothetical protein